jgi:hypothetical protein
MNGVDNPVKGSVFEREFEASFRISKKMTGKPADPGKVAAIICKAVEAKRPRQIYEINNNPLLTILSWLPARVKEWPVRRILQKNRITRKH